MWKEWIKSLGLWFEDEFEEKKFEDALELGGQINANFDEICVYTAKDLHKVIQKRFGKDLPIIFFNREGDDPESIEMTLEANDSYLLDGFTDYLVAYCGWKK